jgi:hypothetical protein
MPRKPKAAPTEVFISHSSKNASFVSRLNGVLTEHKVKSFVSKANIRGAQQWHDEIGTALERCDWFLLVLSPQSVRSMWIKHELVYALQASRYRDASSLSFTSSAIKMRYRGLFRQSNGSTSAGILMKRANSCFRSGN